MRPDGSTPKRLAAAARRKPTTILLWTTIAVVTWRTFGSQAFFLERLWPGGFGDPSLAAALYSDLAALALFGLASLLLAPVMVALSFAASKNPEFLAQYPLWRGACASPAAFAVHAASYLAYYLGFEALFRGLVQFGLRESFGDWNAVLVQTALSTLMHLGKPTGEVYGAVVGGLVFGTLALRTRSLLPVIALHFVLGISLDLFICVR